MQSNNTSELSRAESSNFNQTSVSVSSASGAYMTGAEASPLAHRKSGVPVPLSTSTSRLVNYYKRHGFRATLNRTVLFLQRLFSFPRMVLFYYDLTTCGLAAIPQNRSDGLTVERKISAAEIDSRDLLQI